MLYKERYTESSAACDSAFAFHGGVRGMVGLIIAVALDGIILGMLEELQHLEI